ncbi:MAG: 2-dehydropantoate 2-reductase [Pseudomonadales bacterium]|nr:2-dehydropantoate 2-reductase [Pseudomonadales bacterium]MCP5185054.1 2-dehydropantoate 2-reductase [Pseudomonadales bacterium]
MNIGVVGCGAMGSIYAALLASSGNHVLAVDTNAGHVQAINARGLRVSGASGDRTVRITACVTPPAQPLDLVIIAVKGTHARVAATTAQSLIGAATLVLTIQNGLGAADAVAEVVGGARLIVGVAQGFGASLPAPGHAHHNDMKAIRMGAYDTLDQASVERVVACYQAAGFDAAAAPDIAAMQWEKLICNVAYSAIAALTGLTVGEIMDHPELATVSQAAAVEAWRVARARDIAIAVDDPVRLVRDFAARMPAAKPSVLLDIEAGRRSEVDVINGAVPREAQKVGLDAPVNDTLTRLVLALQRRHANTTGETA